MSNYLVYNERTDALLAHSRRVGAKVFWVSVRVPQLMRGPRNAGVLTWESVEAAQDAAGMHGGIVKPVTEVFDASVILSPH